jgi:hypothetical protein
MGRAATPASVWETARSIRPATHHEPKTTTMRLAKVRTTNYRPPPTAGKPSPVERRPGATTGGSVSPMTGLDHLDAINRRESAEHERAIAGYDEDTLLAVAEDLGKRAVWDRKNPEHRWTMARKAAVLRRLDKLNAFQP